MIGPAASATLILVDLQSRLMPAIDRGDAIVAKCRILAQIAGLLDVPVLATEQNPRGLGHTVDGIAPLALRTFEKVAFDASRESGLVPAIDPMRRQLVVAGCEAHVCVLQTALGLKRAGFDVAVATDAVGSRRPDDKEAALRRAEANGIELVTVEMAVFEWLGRSDHPMFRQVLALIR